MAIKGVFAVVVSIFYTPMIPLLVFNVYDNTSKLSDKKKLLINDEFEENEDQSEISSEIVQEMTRDDQNVISMQDVHETNM